MIRANKPISATQAEAFSRLDRKTQYHAVNSGFFDLRWSDPYFCEYGRLRPVRAVETHDDYEIKPIIYEFGREYVEMKDEFCFYLQVCHIPFTEMEGRKDPYSGKWIHRVKVVPTTYREAVEVGKWIQFHAIIAAMR